MDEPMEDDEGYDYDDEYDELEEADGEAGQNFEGEESAICKGRDVIVAARNGDIATLKQLLTITGRALNVSDWLGLTPLHHAAAQGHLEIIKILMKFGSVKDIKSKVGKSALHMACQEGHAQVALFLLGQGALIDLTDMFLMTPLHWAVERGHRETVSVLLQNGANHTTCDKFNRTCLHIAAANRHHHIIALLQKGNYCGPQSLHSAPHIAKQKISLSAAAGITARATVDESRAGRLNGPDVAIRRGAIGLVTEPGRPRKYRIVCDSQITLSQKGAPRFVYPRHRLIRRMPLERERNIMQGVASDEGDADGEEEENLQSSDRVPELPKLRRMFIPEKEEEEKEAWRVLEAHGIEMLEGEDASLVAAALGGGQKVVLTEAGRQALVMTGAPSDPPPPPPLQPAHAPSVTSTELDAKVAKRIWNYQQAMQHLERKQLQLEIALRNCLAQQQRVKQQYEQFTTSLKGVEGTSYLSSRHVGVDGDLDDPPNSSKVLMPS